MADYARLRNRTHQEYIDEYTSANRRAWDIVKKQVTIEESAPTAPASLSTIAENAKLGSSVIALLSDVLTNVKLRVEPVYLFTRPSTLDFGKAKEVMGEYIANLKYTVLPILKTSASGSNNTLLSNTFGDLSSILALLNNIINEFNKIEKLRLSKVSESRLEPFIPQSIPFSQMSDEEISLLYENLKPSDKERVEAEVQKLLQEKKNAETERLRQEGRSDSYIKKALKLIKFDRRTREYRDIFDRLNLEVGRASDVERQSSRAILRFYEDERNNFIKYRDEITGLVRSVSNYQTVELPDVISGSLTVSRVKDLLKNYIVNTVKKMETPADLRTKYPRIEDLPVEYHMSRALSDDISKFVDKYLQRVADYQRLAIDGLTSDTLRTAYEDMKERQKTKDIISKFYENIYNNLVMDYPEYFADEGRDIIDEKEPQQPSTATTGLAIEEAIRDPIQPSASYQEEPQEDYKSASGRRKIQKKQPKVIYSEQQGYGRGDKIFNVAGAKYNMTEQQLYNPTQSLLSRFDEGERRYMEELTKDNLRFRLHKKKK